MNQHTQRIIDIGHEIKELARDVTYLEDTLVGKTHRLRKLEAELDTLVGGGGDVQATEPVPVNADAKNRAVVELKRNLLHELLQTDQSVVVQFDPRRGAIMPEGFTNEPYIYIRLGLKLQPVLTDLDYQGDAITATLSFNNQPHKCSVPWGAIFAIIGEQTSRGMIFNDDMPPELRNERQAAASSAEEKWSKKNLAGLTSVPLTAVPETKCAFGDACMKTPECDGCRTAQVKPDIAEDVKKVLTGPKCWACFDNGCKRCAPVATNAATETAEIKMVNCMSCLDDGFVNYRPCKDCSVPPEPKGAA